jgi:hypothetical protein
MLTLNSSRVSNIPLSFSSSCQNKQIIYAGLLNVAGLIRLVELLGSVGFVGLVGSVGSVVSVGVSRVNKASKRVELADVVG